MQPRILIPVLWIVAGVFLWTGSASAQPDLPGVSRRDALYDVAIIGSRCLMVGYPGLILRSQDRGRTFERIGPPGRTAYLAVDFVDEKTGVVVGRGGEALWTTDAGDTWERRAVGTSEPLFDVALVDRLTAYAVGNFAAAVRTTDGGRTFTPMKVVSEGEDSTLNSVAFLNVKDGVVVGEMGLLARTADGGDTFERLDDGMAEYHLFGVETWSEGFVAVGSEGAILVSRDRGQTFSRMETPVRENLVRVAISGKRVVVVGMAGTVLVAEDPAGPYRVVAGVPTYQWLAGVRVGTDGRGFAVGARATLLVTDDFGHTWQAWRAR